ncbi:helix-turn-helix domain-containing protein [Salipiger sp. IMCC34102]|uniref:helix-turn-helix domain-containing protein n=1 Tax=Salipiger sp. IMCC34102 TaxID=2510647 RepID=UPI001F5D165F|nr:helix-turn-helix domain-containing protein [Salipiger sp. IMCC34102]
MLGLSQDDLVKASGISKRTIAGFELASGNPSERTIRAIRLALQEAGAEFIEENGGGVGVRLRKRSTTE